MASALARLAFSCRYFRWLCHGRIWLVGAYGGCTARWVLPRRRKGKRVRCQCGFTATYARRTTAPRRDGLRPRGCLLVLLRSMCDARWVLTQGRNLLSRRATRREERYATHSAPRVCRRDARSARKMRPRSQE